MNTHNLFAPLFVGKDQILMEKKSCKSFTALHCGLWWCLAKFHRNGMTYFLTDYSYLILISKLLHFHEIEWSNNSSKLWKRKKEQEHFLTFLVCWPYSSHAPYRLPVFPFLDFGDWKAGGRQEWYFVTIIVLTYCEKNLF